MFNIHESVYMSLVLEPIDSKIGRQIYSQVYPEICIDDVYDSYRIEIEGSMFLGSLDECNITLDEKYGISPLHLSLSEDGWASNMMNITGSYVDGISISKLLYKMYKGDLGGYPYYLARKYDEASNDSECVDIDCFAESLMESMDACYGRYKQDELIDHAVDTFLYTYRNNMPEDLFELDEEIIYKLFNMGSKRMAPGNILVLGKPRRGIKFRVLDI